MARRTYAPPYMRRHQRTFPQSGPTRVVPEHKEEAPKEVEADPTLAKMLEEWGDSVEAPLTVAPEVAEVATPPSVETPDATKGPQGKAALMRLSRKNLVGLASEKGVSLPQRLNKSQIVELLLKHSE